MGKRRAEGFLEWFDRMSAEGVRVADRARDGVAMANDTLQAAAYGVKLHTDAGAFLRKLRAAVRLGGKGK